MCGVAFVCSFVLLFVRSFVRSLQQGCKPDVVFMQRILMLRGLVLTPEQDIHSWLKFATLCRIKKNFRISKKVSYGREVKVGFGVVTQSVQCVSQEGLCKV